MSYEKIEPNANRGRVEQNMVNNTVYVPELLAWGKRNSPDPDNHNTYIDACLDDFMVNLKDKVPGIRFVRIRPYKAAVYYPNAAYTNGIITTGTNDEGKAVYSVYARSAKNRRHSWGDKQHCLSSISMTRAISNVRKHCTPMTGEQVLEYTQRAAAHVYETAAEEVDKAFAKARDEAFGEPTSYPNLEKKTEDLLRALYEGARQAAGVAGTVAAAVEMMGRYLDAKKARTEHQKFVERSLMIYRDRADRFWLRNVDTDKKYGMRTLGTATVKFRLPDDVLGKMAVADMMPMQNAAAGIGGRVAPNIYLLFNTVVDDADNIVFLNHEE